MLPDTPTISTAANLPDEVIAAYRRDGFVKDSRHHHAGGGGTLSAGRAGVGRAHAPLLQRPHLHPTRQRVARERRHPRR